MPTWTQQNLLAEMQTALARLIPGTVPGDFQLETSLVSDYEVDSLKFVDFTVALEKILAYPAFPIQGWLDEQERHTGRPYTIGSLVEYCLSQLKARQPPAGGKKKT